MMGAANRRENVIRPGVLNNRPANTNDPDGFKGEGYKKTSKGLPKIIERLSRAKHVVAFVVAVLATVPLLAAIVPNYMSANNVAGIGAEAEKYKADRSVESEKIKAGAEKYKADKAFAATIAAEKIRANTERYKADKAEAVEKYKADKTASAAKYTVDRSVQNNKSQSQVGVSLKSKLKSKPFVAVKVRNKKTKPRTNLMKV